MQNKSKKLTSRLLSALLSLACVLTLLPGVVVAAESTGSTGGMVVNKTAVLEDNGTYTITLEAYATGTTTTVTQESGVPLDIVLVIDQSGSMAYNDNGWETNTAWNRRMEKLKTAVTGFVKSVSENGKQYHVDHRVALVGYASNYDAGQSHIEGAGYNGSSEYWVNTGLYVGGHFKNYRSQKNDNLSEQDYQNALVSVNDAEGKITSSITTAINSFKASGGTYTEYGLTMAQKVFDNNPIKDGTKRQRIVILFTDGETDSEIDTVLQKANALKGDSYNATIYSVGFGKDVKKDFLSHVSSNYKTARYYYSYYDEEWIADKYSMMATNSEELSEIFQTISSSIQNPTTTVQLDEQSVMKDILADGFVLPEGYNATEQITVQTAKGSTEDGQSITFDSPTPSVGIQAKVEPKGTITVTGFDYAGKYIAPSHNGEKLIVTIHGIEATDAAITDAEISTNNALSGIYAKTDDESPAVQFPQPKTILKRKTYVLDYGKPVKLTSKDWGIGSVTTLNGTGMHKFDTSVTNLTETYGKVETATEKTGLTYTPTTMNWKGYDSFYVFGKQILEGATNQWSKVTVMPANSVYYEDTFVTDKDTGTVGIEYSGDWTTDGTDANRDYQTLDKEPYGWEEGYAKDTTYSDGSAHKAVASEDNKASASFTFTGTGVDVYSRTDLTTGTVAATLTKKGEDGKEVREKGLIVDNLAASVGDGAYYQIPTLHFDVPYGEYTLTLYVTTAAKERATYYLDGVRVYNPIQGLEEEAVVKEAYGNAGELGASFRAVRDILIHAKNFNPINEEVEGAVFIDQVGNKTGVPTKEIGTYEDYGPKNEVYLAKGQSIAFQVDVTQEANYYLGIKAPNGATTAEVTNDAGKSTLNIEAASDLYYKITPNAYGYILVKNTGDCLLSITKLRTTGANGESTITAANVSELLAYANAFDTLEEVAGSTESGEVQIENPEVNELGSGSIAWDWLEKIFKGIRDLLRP